MEDNDLDYYTAWDRVIDLTLVLAGFFIAVLLYIGIPV